MEAYQGIEKMLQSEFEALEETLFTPGDTTP